MPKQVFLVLPPLPTVSYCFDFIFTVEEAYSFQTRWGRVVHNFFQILKIRTSFSLNEWKQYTSEFVCLYLKFC